jgi:hypothetical protein
MHYFELRNFNFLAGSSPASFIFYVFTFRIASFEKENNILDQRPLQEASNFQAKGEILIYKIAPCAFRNFNI